MSAPSPAVGGTSAPRLPLRVLYVSPHAHLGGAERVTLDLVAGHDRQVVTPLLVFLRDGPLVAHARHALGVPTQLIPAPRARQLLRVRRTVREIARHIVQHRVDLVHSSMAWGHLFGGLAARRARRPAVWFQHIGASWSRHHEVAAALVPCRAIIANSAFTAARQRRVNPLRARIAVIHPGTRLPTEPLEERRARGRRALGIGAEEFAVGIAARLQRGKGQHLVIRAAASLCHARADARLFVLGEALFGLDDSYGAELRRLAGELGIWDRVVFTGHRNDVSDCLAALDVAVHASIAPESFGLGLIEAMAAGAALVAAEGGAAREILSPGEDALLLRPGDHEALAAALLALHDDPALRRRLAATGEATVRERFDVAIMTRRMEALYAAVLGARRGEDSGEAEAGAAGATGP